MAQKDTQRSSRLPLDDMIVRSVCPHAVLSPQVSIVECIESVAVPEDRKQFGDEIDD